ncbi:MAG: VWA domain-containing protein, partial [Bdellovibrionota bacterium]
MNSDHKIQIGVAASTVSFIGVVFAVASLLTGCMDPGKPTPKSFDAEVGASAKTEEAADSETAATDGSSCPSAGKGRSYAAKSCGGGESKARVNKAGETLPIKDIKMTNASLSATAYRTDGGGLRLILNPVIRGETDKIHEKLSDSDITFRYGGKKIDRSQIQTVSPTSKAATDIVFVIDTTGSMEWAIGMVKYGMKKFVDQVRDLGFRPRIGGIEFGDEVRTSTDMGDLATFRTWVDTLTAEGGGDAAEAPLDAILYANRNFKFREHAQKYYVVITDQGIHEDGDGSGCSDTTLKEVQDELRGRAFVGVLHSQLYKGFSGLSPRFLVKALGGLYLNVNVLDAMIEADVELSTPITDGIRHPHT